VRLYHGRLTKLPKRYVTRQRLCLRGTTDYWVNEALGQPFFSIERPIDHGMLEALQSDIVPRLLKDVPGQPTDEHFKVDPYLSRFVILFDREGYSPAFFRPMWQDHRIAGITYHDYPKEAWPESWFTETKVTTAYGLLGLENAASLFSRWCQENFFRYMMEHVALDALSEYGTEAISGTPRPVVNLARRELDRQFRSVKSKLTPRQARFAALTLHPQAEESDITKWEREKGKMQEEIEQLEHELTVLKERMPSTPKHWEWDELPEGEKFQRLAPSRKRLTDTVKLVAYRAETALAMIVREKMSHADEARSLLRDLFRSDADIYPDAAAGVLEVRLHTLANPRSNRAIQHLLDHLNAAEFVYPGTTLRLTYTLTGPRKNDDKVPFRFRRGQGF